MNTRAAAKPAQPAAWIRRQRVQRELALQRAAIRDAWRSFEQASFVAQARAHRVIDLTRTLSLIVGVIAAAIALRRAAQGRARPGPALRAVALAGALRRFLPVARRLLSPYP